MTNLTIETAHRIVDLEEIIKQHKGLIGMLSDHIDMEISGIEYEYSLLFLEDRERHGSFYLSKEDVEAVINYRKQEIEKCQKELFELTHIIEE